MSARRPLLRRLFPSPALSLTVVAFWMVKAIVYLARLFF